MQVLDEKSSNFLAKVAYESFCGIRNRDPNSYFQIDAPDWKDLPQSSKKHWVMIVDAIFLAMGDMDAGDTTE